MVDIRCRIQVKESKGEQDMMLLAVDQAVAELAAAQDATTKDQEIVTQLRDQRTIDKDEITQLNRCFDQSLDALAAKEATIALLQAQLQNAGRFSHSSRML